MKPGTFLFVAMMAPALLSHAQAKDPGNKLDAAPSPSVSAPSGSAPAVSASLAAAAPATYVIGATDVLAVTVWKETTLSGTLLVRPDGMISMPLLGDVQASGLTPLKLADEITTKLLKYMQDPKVSVVLTQINSKKVFMMGEIEKKGPVEMTPGMTVLQAIGSAGGLTTFANAKKIYILRDEAGSHLKIPVHYKAALKGDSSLDLTLKNGDTIVVP